ncbi:cation transporting ATPase C-terminal domain-containing protein [Sulfuriferula sp. AH1]|uniref:cation transporting ATPase C-terminal domain-containing protein n=1 Tax=Sulfuriferula sp. AH1 TaxID=1985873 RepID=UPI002101C0DD|nr:cation-translocating P-type ATPase C-terminal domain-containing protein [Sulfuriferula sp. AH1]
MVISLYWAALAAGIDTAQARTMTFVALITANAVLILSSRSLLPGPWRALRGGNRATCWVLAGTLLALVVVTWVPAVAQVFAFAPLAWGYWLTAFGIGAASFIVFESVKWRGSRGMP